MAPTKGPAMPPDPGEPHEPREEDFESWDDYLQALDDYVRIMVPPQEKAIRKEAIMGQIKINKFLEEVVSSLPTKPRPQDFDNSASYELAMNDYLASLGDPNLAVEEAAKESLRKWRENPPESGWE